MDMKDIIEKIERPLLFASREDFRYIGQVKGLENLVMKNLSELKSICGGRDFLGKLLSDLENAFQGFEGAAVDLKIQCLRTSLVKLGQIKGALRKDEHSSPDKLEESASLLSQPVQYVRGVGPKIASMFEKKGIRTVEDLLYFLPRRYEDRRSVKPIAQLQPGARETLVGRVISSEFKRFGRTRLFEVNVGDESGFIKAKWFHGAHAYLKETFAANRKVILTGDVRGNLILKEMIHPDYELVDDDDNDLLDFRRIVPVYSETEGLHQKKIRKTVRQALDLYAGHLESPLPEGICRRLSLPSIREALEAAHFPAATEDINLCNDMASPAIRRLVFDDFFYFELGMALRKKSNVLEKGIAFRKSGKLIDKFYRSLPFELTQAQKRVIGEIHADMARPCQMNRLLQGDVGCGKTAVSFSAMALACENGYQSAIMAPTEILANQHFRNIERWAKNLGLRAALVTGSRKGVERKGLAGLIEAGEIDIIVGTHALVQEGTNFRRLGLAVIDEQHRFGVVQRATLREKGECPDVLFMTATPIPRTLAMTVYADLDLSVIDELPPGKQPIRTKVFFERERSRVYEIIRKEVKKGSQAFIVYPLVEESEALDLRDATRMAGHLQKEIFPDLRVGLIHGRMGVEEKDSVMAAFSSRDIDILVSTTVIEVGIDIPEASLMVIEHAERFGLSQLHQLRGRVGRGAKASYCILMTDFKKTETATRRLRVMEQTNDGFKIAEEDLRIRGPGDLMGIRQSGLPDFRVANILRDGRLLHEARTEAFALVESDPGLSRPEHRLLKEVLIQRWGGKLQLAKTG